MRTDRLDRIDQAIVSCLLDNARASYAEIGARVNLSAPAVKRRVDRLQQDGVIKGFTAVVDELALGRGTEAFVEVYCAGRMSPAAIRDAMARHPEVVDLCTVTGDSDAVVRLLTADVAHLEEALERIRREPNILRTRSVIVLSRLLSRAAAAPA